jgi:hypothetical protein
MGLMAMSGFYSDIMYGSGLIQLSWQGTAKRGEPINIGNRAALNRYLEGIPLGSSIVISLADVHGHHEIYSKFTAQVQSIKDKGFSKIYVIINGDLAPRLDDYYGQCSVGEGKADSLEYACKNFLLELSKLAEIIFNLGNHELQNSMSFYNLLSFLKTKNIPFLTHIPDGIDLNQLIEDSNRWTSFYKQWSHIPKITDTATATELQTNTFSYKIIENILFFPYCSSFLVYCGGCGVEFLKNDYANALETLYNDRTLRDNLPTSADNHLITKILKESFQNAIAKLAEIPGPINIVIAAHEFYHPWDDEYDRVRGIFELILRDIVIPEDVLNRLTWTIVCGHEHQQYHHLDQSLKVGSKIVPCDVIGTTVYAAEQQGKVPNFAIMAFKPIQPLPPAQPITYAELLRAYRAMPNDSQHAEERNRLSERLRIWRLESAEQASREREQALRKRYDVVQNRGQLPPNHKNHLSNPQIRILQGKMHSRIKSLNGTDHWPNLCAMRIGLATFVAFSILISSFLLF